MIFGGHVVGLLNRLPPGFGHTAEEGAGPEDLGGFPSLMEQERLCKELHFVCRNEMFKLGLVTIELRWVVDLQFQDLRSGSSSGGVLYGQMYDIVQLLDAFLQGLDRVSLLLDIIV